jgi:hypothetical protein
MAWPELEYVSCTGFDKALLPLIKRACDSGLVKWVAHSRGFLDGAEGTFEWSGCVWLMDEFNEWVTSITLKNGTQPDSESLTVALLGGKIESS